MSKSMNRFFLLSQILLVCGSLSACRRGEEPEPAPPAPAVTVTATPKPVVTPVVTATPTTPPPCVQGGYTCGTKFLSAVSNSCFTFKDSSGTLMRRLYVRFLVTADGIGPAASRESIVSANLKGAVQDPSLSGRKAVALVTGEDGRVCLSGAFDSLVQIAKGIRFASEVMFEAGGVASSYPLLNRTINTADELACASASGAYYTCSVALGGSTIQVGQTPSFRLSSP